MVKNRTKSIEGIKIRQNDMLDDGAVTPTMVEASFKTAPYPGYWSVLVLSEKGYALQVESGRPYDWYGSESMNIRPKSRDEAAAIAKSIGKWHNIPVEVYRRDGKLLEVMSPTQKRRKPAKKKR